MRYSVSKTLKPGVGFVQGYWKWCHD